MEVWSIINLKGGIGKTTGAINMATVLHKIHKQRVLLCEMSKQGNIEAFYGSANQAKMEDVLAWGKDIKLAITQSPSGVDYIPGGMGLLKPASRDPMHFKRALEEVARDYDYVIVDCEPSFDLPVLSALIASNKVIIPTLLDRYSVDGVKKIIDQLEEVKQLNEKLELAGVFVTMFANNKLNRELLEKVSKEIKLMQTIIKRSTKVEEMSWRKESVILYSPNCQASKGYQALVEELLAL